MQGRKPSSWSLASIIAPIWCIHHPQSIIPTSADYGGMAILSWWPPHCEIHSRKYYLIAYDHSHLQLFGIDLCGADPLKPQLLTSRKCHQCFFDFWSCYIQLVLWKCLIHRRYYHSPTVNLYRSNTLLHSLIWSPFFHLGFAHPFNVSCYAATNSAVHSPFQNLLTQRSIFAYSTYAWNSVLQHKSICSGSRSDVLCNMNKRPLNSYLSH